MLCGGLPVTVLHRWVWLYLVFWCWLQSLLPYWHPTIQSSPFVRPNVVHLPVSMYLVVQRIKRNISLVLTAISVICSRVLFSVRGFPWKLAFPLCHSQSLSA